MSPVPTPDAGGGFDIPAWIEAVGTDLAFLVVAWTLLLQLKDRRAEQAKNIDYHVWAERKTGSYRSDVVPSQPVDRQPPLGLTQNEYGHIWMTIRNNSSNPINDLILLMPWGKVRHKSVGKIPPGEYTLLYTQLAGMPWDGDDLDTLVPRIQFRDESGRVWQRTANGGLRRIGKRRKKQYGLTAD